MKKVLSIILALAMTLSLASCGEEVTLADITTEQGISLKLPSDMTAESAAIYSNTDKSDVVSFGSYEYDPATPVNEWAQEDFIASELADHADLEIISFDNTLEINGLPALVCKFTFTTAGGNAVTSAVVVVDGSMNEYVIALTYRTDNADGALATNLDACIGSITIAE